MNCYEYARDSRVHVDACREHGIWFDHDELRRIIQSLQSGGLPARSSDRGDRAAPSSQTPVDGSDVWFWLDLLDFVSDIFIGW